VLGSYLDLGSPVAKHPLNEGLVGWWLPLTNNAGGGTLFDLGRRYHGTLASGVAWAGGSRPGALGPCLSFDGTDDIVTTSTTPAATGDYSLSFWLRKPLTTRIVFAHRTGGNNGWRVMALNNGVMRFSLGGVEDNNLNSLVYSASAWHWLCITVSGTSLTGYLSAAGGGPLASETITIGALSGTPDRFVWGDGLFGGFEFDGLIDDTRVASRRWPDADVRALYSQSLRGHPDTLRRWSRKAWLMSPPAGGGGGGNRRRRVILCGGR
jgi:hypothetical protein